MHADGRGRGINGIQGGKLNLRDDVVCEEDKPEQDHSALHIAAYCS